MVLGIGVIFLEVNFGYYRLNFDMLVVVWSCLFRRVNVYWVVFFIGDIWI